MKKPSRKILDEASYYQYVLDGKVLNLAVMDRGQLLRALMKTIDVLSKVEDSLCEATTTLSQWADTGE